MPRAQLTIFPAGEMRRASRRIVNLAASLRDKESRVIEIEVNNLSVTGFMASGTNLSEGSKVWVKLTGLEPRACSVVWNEDGKTGFEFTTPLHEATLELIEAGNRKPRLINYFGPGGKARSMKGAPK